MKKLISVILCMMTVFAMPLLCCAENSDYSGIFSSAGCAIVMDAHSGEIIFEKNADDKRLIASTTKIMTAVVVIESCNLDDVVTVPDEAVGTEGSSAYLTHNEKLSIRELLYCLMLPSGNDAAAALAIITSGSIDEFAVHMNEKAAALGMENTHFENPHGLDGDNHMSTARDMAILTRYAMNNEEFSKIVSTKSISIGTRTLTNHNKLLWSVEGINGVKTGYTKAAGRILITSAVREGLSLICVTIGDKDDYAEHTEMYKKAFSELYCERICSQNEDFCTIPVISGERDSAILSVARDVFITRKTDDVVTLEVELPSFLYGDVEKDEVVGRLTVLINGQEKASANIISKEEIKTDGTNRLNLWERIKRLFRISFKYGGSIYPQW